MRLFVISGAVAALTAFAGAAQAADIETYFAIMRNGEDIGTHSVVIRGTPERREVDIRVDILVKIAFVPVYRSAEVKHEVYENGRLVFYEGTEKVNSNDESKLTARAADGKIEIVGSAGNITGPADLLPSTYWNRDLMDRTQAMDSTTGAIDAIHTREIGWETVPDPDGGPGTVRAKRYRVTGGFERDLWYDETGRWVGMSLTASDGSKIVYRAKKKGGEG